MKLSDDTAEQRPGRWKTLPRPRSWFWMICGLLGGVAIPIICFVSAFAVGTPNVPDAWQSGQPDQYAVLMTKWPNVWPFYPFLAYCMVCCGLVLVGGQRWIDRLGVRFGIYTGVPLAIQYHMLVFPPRDWNPFSILPSLLSLAIGIPVTFVLLGILLVAGSLLRQVFGSRAMAVTAVVVFVGWVSSFAFRTPVEISIILFAFVFFGTIFATTTYGTLSWYVWSHTEERHFRFGLLSIVGLLTWVAGYIAAWRASVLMAIAEYETLPLTQPNCYVCTAAARGHARFVRSFTVAMPDGLELTVNRQLQVLKAAELALRTTSPMIHLWIRAIYNRMGPRIASRIRHAWVADVAYVGLKLVEWPVRGAFRIVGIRGAIDRLYIRAGDSQCDK